MISHTDYFQSRIRQFQILYFHCYLLVSGTCQGCFIRGYYEPLEQDSGSFFQQFDKIINSVSHNICCITIRITAISISLMIKNRSAKKILNNSAPSIESYGIPSKIFIQVLKVFSIFILCFLFDK